MEDYVNGYIERDNNGVYVGKLTIDGVHIGGITGMYFKRDGDTYLWLRRRKILEYNDTTMTYNERDARPRWECYLKKQIENNETVYRGEFTFIRFRFSIVGLWDAILGHDKKQRLNLFVERLPINEQSIINNINERKRNEL